jgi:hypothetical protein
LKGKIGCIKNTAINLNIMKRLFKNVNTFGLLGILVMGLLVFTQSAFKPADHKTSVDLVYGYDASNPSAPWVADGTPGYSCVLSNDVCKYTFATPPSNAPGSVTPRSAGTPLISGPEGTGSYQQID